MYDSDFDNEYDSDDFEDFDEEDEDEFDGEARNNVDVGRMSDNESTQTRQREKNASSRSERRRVAAPGGVVASELISHMDSLRLRA